TGLPPLNGCGNTPSGVSACGSAHLGAQPTILEADLLPFILRMTLTPPSQAMMSNRTTTAGTHSIRWSRLKPPRLWACSKHRGDVKVTSLFGSRFAAARQADRPLPQPWTERADRGRVAGEYAHASPCRKVRISQGAR